jgi:bifunctional UDP-N-acetylglucosamine pyrophosphorylase/glucosamine-1-phosphate N-acetyltransferase
MADLINTVLLAAGKGTRLKIEIPKPLCPVLGRTLVDYVIDGLISFSDESKVNLEYNFVVGHEKEQVQNYIDKNHPKLGKSFSWQKEQLGTGHAVQTFFDENPKAWENEFTLIVCADTPLITSEIYSRLYNEIVSTETDAVCASFITQSPKGYGRISHGEFGFQIIEEKDATQIEREITEVNSGLYIFKTAYIKNYLYSIDTENKSNELYLTDLFKKDANVRTVIFSSETEFLGVNNLIQLSDAEQVLKKRKIQNLQLAGVRFITPESAYIEESVNIEAGTVIYPNVSLFGTTTVGKNVTLENGVIIKNSSIAASNLIKAYTYIEGATIANNCAVGPMARIREGSDFKENCKIGNFVETKKVTLDEGVKVSHLSYVGDAKIGENTNIGCGFITCNYDGANKHLTKIGKNSFIGSDCQMIAPVTLGDDVYVGSGSTINKDIPSGGFGIARQRQVIKEGMAHKFIKKKTK